MSSNDPTFASKWDVAHAVHHGNDADRRNPEQACSAIERQGERDAAVNIGAGSAARDGFVVAITDDVTDRIVAVTPTRRAAEAAARLLAMPDVVQLEVTLPGRIESIATTVRVEPSR